MKINEEMKRNAMLMSSTEYLKQIVKLSGFMVHDIKNDVVLIKDQDGVDIKMTLPPPLSLKKFPVDLPLVIFKDFLDANLIEKSGRIFAGMAKEQEFVVYQLTQDGIKRGS